MIKPILGGSAIALAFFTFAYFVIGLEHGTACFWGAVGLLALQSAIIGGVWGVSLYCGARERERRG